MSDESVAAALRSPARLVVVEAPAGCGKTFQGAEYANHAASRVGDGRVLILAHTHAACDVFSSRTHEAKGSVEIRTIDSLISQIASAYHCSLGLPSDAGAWARSREDGFSELAALVVRLLVAWPIIPRSLVQRYPVVICDEHQDASADQHAIVMTFYRSGALVRIFGDPMQRIYGSRKKAVVRADGQRWEYLKQKADVFGELVEPHRWFGGSEPLGRWILAARASLHVGNRVDLRHNLPLGIVVIVAENQLRKRPGGYVLTKEDAKPIRGFVEATDSLLVLAAHNETVDALRALFGPRLPIWEGHVRDALATLVSAVEKHKGDATEIAHAVNVFLGQVATGFSFSAFGHILLQEVRDGCVAKRSGKPGTLQGLGRLLLDQPDHKGVAMVLHRLKDLTATDSAFRAVHVDYHHEFWEAVRLGQFDDPNEGFAEISRRRTYLRPSPQSKAISTVHKAKGLECSHVLIIPCDAKHFPDTPAARCRLYVAMSRAKRSLTFVVSQEWPSPLIAL